MRHAKSRVVAVGIASTRKLRLGVSLIAACVLAITALLPAPARAYSFDGSASVLVGDRGYSLGHMTSMNRNDLGLPTIETLTAQRNGVWSTIQLDLSESGFYVDNDMFGIGSESTSAYHLSAAGSYEITLDRDTAFDVSGFFQTSGGEADRVMMSASVRNISTREYLFEMLHRSDATPDARLELGADLGDDYNITSGNLSGVLLAGERYLFQYRMQLDDPYLENSLDGSATGRVEIHFPVPIPEPGTGVSTGLGLAALTACRRRERWGSR